MSDLIAIGSGWTAHPNVRKPGPTEGLKHLAAFSSTGLGAEAAGVCLAVIPPPGGIRAVFASYPARYAGMAMDDCRFIVACCSAAGLAAVCNVQIAAAKALVRSGSQVVRLGTVNSRVWAPQTLTTLKRQS